MTGFSHKKLMRNYIHICSIHLHIIKFKSTNKFVSLNMNLINLIVNLKIRYIRTVEISFLEPYLPNMNKRRVRLYERRPPSSHMTFIYFIFFVFFLKIKIRR